MSELSSEQMRFLHELVPFNHPVSRRDLARLADRKEDRIRQSCKRLGLAEFVGGWIDGKKWPMGWRLTAKGRALLRPLPHSKEGGKP